jgi:deazaflavin-dependent oxidoreductase (nitroreductase family)
MPTPIGNLFMKTLVNSPLHPLLGKSFAVITVTGRKTGKPIETPINVVCVCETQMVSSMRNRTWWRNLRGGRTARLRQSGKLITVRGEVVEIPAEVAAGLAGYFAQYPGYAKYLNVRLGPDGKPDSREMERVARERVLIKLQAA